MQFIDRQIKRLITLACVLALSGAIFWDASERHAANSVQKDMLFTVKAESYCTQHLGGMVDSAGLALPADYTKVMHRAASKKGRKS